MDVELPEPDELEELEKLEEADQLVEFDELEIEDGVLAVAALPLDTSQAPRRISSRLRDACSRVSHIIFKSPRLEPERNWRQGPVYW